MPGPRSVSARRVPKLGSVSGTAATSHADLREDGHRSDHHVGRGGHVYVYVCIYVYIYIYIYRERERYVDRAAAARPPTASPASRRRRRRLRGHFLGDFKDAVFTFLRIILRFFENSWFEKKCAFASSNWGPLTV